MYRVLLVDDDPHILRVNEAYLKKRGYQVYSVQDGTAALAVAETAELDAVILDVDMPGLDGITVCRRLRELRTVPVVFLSAYAKTDDRIRGLQAGGDDYLAKPYSLVELELRLRLRIEGGRAVKRREVLYFDGLEIDPELREARCGGEIASFTALEFDLLAFLAQHPGQVFPTRSSPSRCGGPRSTRACTTSRSAWLGCGRSWTPWRPAGSISRPSEERATASAEKRDSYGHGKSQPPPGAAGRNMEIMAFCERA